MDPAAPAPGHQAKLELAADAARKFGKVRIRVTGSSMLPVVWPGDVLTVVRQPLSRFRPGDIALALRQGGERPSQPLPDQQFVAHRVVRIETRSGNAYLITRGDALLNPDPPLSEDEILGRVVSVTRNGRPVDASLTRSRKLAAWVLGRSDLSVRVMLRLVRLARTRG